MTAHVPGVQPQTPPVQPSAPSSRDALTAGAVASTHGGETLTTSTKISSMEDLKKKAPKLYNKMMEGIAMAICNDMKAHQDRLKKMMDDARQRDNV